MIRLFHITLAICSLAGMSLLQAQDLVINEFMSDNESTLQDRDGDYPDWIELYNRSQETVNLYHYGISDDPGEPGKWLLPEVHLPAGGFLVIFASGKEMIATTELHATFRISSSGEVLILTDNQGTLLHTCDPVNLQEDMTLSRIPDGGEHWVHSSIPTPGAPNRTENHLTFSAEQGFYQAPFQLLIHSLKEDTVYFTRDGSLPSPRSTPFSRAIFLEFTDQIPDCFSTIPTSPEQSQIAYKAWEAPSSGVDKAHVIRCASFRNGKRTSPVYTRTYFVGAGVHDKYSLPVLSLVTDSSNLFAADSGIYIPGHCFDPADPQWTGNYFEKGRDWERPVHLSYFSSDGDLCLSQDAGLRIHGGLTRHAAQKTLRLYARDEYGLDEFNYPLLPQKTVSNYNRFLLRTTMGAWRGQTMIADVLAHELVRNLDFEIMDYQPVIVYLNGEYWGIHTLRDRVDEHYIEYISGIDADSVDMINSNIGLVDAGSNAHFLQLTEFIENNDLSLKENYDFVANQIDISSFTDYIIAEMFFANSDWPGNNQKLWRPQTAGGKWRWIFMDLDAAYDPRPPDIFDFSMEEEGARERNSEPVSSFLLRNLLKNQLFGSFFTERFAEILKTEFIPTKSYRIMEQIASLYKEELPRHISRWGYPSSVSRWQSDVENHLIDFLKIRPCKVAGEVIRYFNLDHFGFSCGSSEEFDARFRLVPNPNDGNFCIRNISQESTLFNLTLTDMSGRMLFSEKNIILDQGERKDFSFNQLAGGVYYVSLTGPSQNTVKSLVVY